ncbi:unnamed protein product [Boreogadus saida]
MSRSIDNEFIDPTSMSSTMVHEGRPAVHLAELDPLAPCSRSLVAICHLSLSWVSFDPTSHICLLSKQGPGAPTLCLQRFGWIILLGAEVQSTEENQTVEENWHGGMGPDTVHTGSLCKPRRETPLPFVVVTHELSIAVLLGLDMAF